jgi:hypothetical protein
VIWVKDAGLLILASAAMRWALAIETGGGMRRKCVVCGTRVRRSQYRTTVVILGARRRRLAHWWCVHPSDTALRALLAKRPGR